MDQVSAVDAPKSEPGRLFYSRWLLLVFGALLFLLILERVVIHRSFIGPEETVRRQLEALQRADFGQAYTYAARGIRQKFEVSEFRSMVLREFPEFVHSSKMAIDRKEIHDGDAVFEVSVTGAERTVLRAGYFLILEDGHWRVSAVTPIGTSGMRRRQGATT
jgi:hypothetical protein